LKLIYPDVTATALSKSTIEPPIVRRRCTRGGCAQFSPGARSCG
jgi:hypothetical protein